MRFREKLVEIDAIQFNGTRDNVLEIIVKLDAEKECWYYDEDKQTLDINTFAGRMVASKGDWITKNMEGEFYRCKSDIFDLTYEPVIVGKEMPTIPNTELYCPGCGKPKVLCLNDTTGCSE